jgi:phosphate transport system protein
MAPEQLHTVKSFDADLQRLANLITRMGGCAETQIEGAIRAMAARDTTLAGEIIEADARIDRFEAEVNDEAVRLLALRQPVASDLRAIVAALKMASDLERIGDYASNIAKRSIALAQVPPAAPAVQIPRMGRLCQELVHAVLDAFIERDVEKAVAAWERDEELDELYTSLFREVLTYMMEDPRNITACAHLLFIAKNLERIGDHATNIAETIYYLVVGQPLTVARPKGDQSSFVSVPVAGTVAVVAEPRPPGERSARSAG